VWVRVARFEGGTAEGLEAEIAQTKQHLADAKSGGLPPGLEGVRRVLEGIDRDGGTGVSLVFCDTEEELHNADEAAPPI